MAKVPVKGNQHDREDRGGCRRSDKCHPKAAQCLLWAEPGWRAGSVTRPEMARPSKASATARFKVKQRLTLSFLRINNKYRHGHEGVSSNNEEARTARITPNETDDSMS